jgi:hypothetical protein
MLRRLKIGYRLNLLIAVPLLALIAAVVASTIALHDVSVRGSEYQHLKLAQQLVADTNPPPVSLLESWALVNQVGVIAASPDGFSASSLAQIDSIFSTIEGNKITFQKTLGYWFGQDLPQRVRIRLIFMGGSVGAFFFNVIATDLKDAVGDHDTGQVLSVIRSLEWRYNLQKSGVDRALAWAIPEVAAREKSTDDFVGKAILYGGAAAAAALLLTILLVAIIRRSISKPIRALVARAQSVATAELPDAVRTMQLSDNPEREIVHLSPFDSGTRDELAVLAASFNSVQDAALDLAAEQALARRVVSQNLVNIARRNQNLLGRTLGFISSLEEGERDPEALDNLFRLDHLTTRMRRNAQSLLVLAGAEPTRLWSPAVAIGDVVRAALSEVENYGQVELAELGDIGVLGSAAGEVAHLLAELLENATSFSPPTSPVTVVGRAVPDGHQLAIFDYGLGMSTEELAEANRRLNEVSSFDSESNKMLGFQVVARLAARYSIKVMLTTTPGGNGVTAIVRLPKAILEVIATPGSGAGPISSVISERISEPLPTTAKRPEEAPLATMTRPAGDLATLQVTSPVGASAMAATMDFQPLPAEPPPAPAAPSTTDAGLTRRVRGAQMPDLGSRPTEAAPRPADEVRNTLASLQRGIDLGRQRKNDG